MGRKDFKKHNTGFLCIRCGVQNEPAKRSERNHCFNCLYSLHVDEHTPGDRKTDCSGLMEPISLDYRGNKGFMILHKCVKCGKQIKNKAAEEDKLEGLGAVHI